MKRERSLDSNEGAGATPEGSLASKDGSLDAALGRDVTGAGLLASGDAADEADGLFLATPERSATGDRRSPMKEEASVAVSVSVAVAASGAVPIAVS